MPTATVTPSAPAPPSGPPKPPPDRPTGDPSRTGTLWVGATGVSLLLAAAAVLTAVRWGDIGQTAKLGGFVAITLGMLIGGRHLQRTIPLTGRAIFHLGALLIPLDMAAVAVLAERTWQETLLLTSMTAVAAWYALVRVDPSPVLTWAARGSVVLAAAGIAAVSPLSMPLVLAGAAAAATAFTISKVNLGTTALASGRSSKVWTLTAGLLPLAGFVRWPTQLEIAVGDLGFLQPDRPQSVLAGLTATALAAIIARCKPTLEQGWAVVVLATSSTVTAAAMFTNMHAWWVTLAVAFLFAELAALAIRRDRLWMQITSIVMPLVEAAAGVGTFVVLIDAWLIRTSTTLLVSAVVLCLAWLTADRRRVLEPNDWLVGLLFGADWRPASFLVPVAALAAAVASSASGAMVSFVLLASGAWTVATGRRDARLVAALCSLASVAITAIGWAGVIVCSAAALLLAAGARLDLRRGASGEAVLGGIGAAFFALTLLAPLGGLVDIGVALVCIAVLGWMLGWLTSLDLGEVATFPTKGLAVLTLAAMPGLDPGVAIGLGLVVASLAAVDGWRSERWTPTVISGVAIGLVFVPLGELVGFSIAETGLAMCAAAMVAIGVQIAIPQPMELPLGALAFTLCGIGLAASAGSALLAGALMLVGATIVLFGAANDCPPLIGIGALTVTTGTWMQLSFWEVTWLEAYLALPALAALWVGSIWHRRGITSWAAYAPTIAVFGFVAAVDRFDGGSAWHAVIAGGVGVLAVLAGGWWRLAGPLITGTGLVAAVTVYESLGPGSRVPTWGWLALGGVVLLAAAVQMERSATTPLEQGQRVLDVLATRFS